MSNVVLIDVADDVDAAQQQNKSRSALCCCEYINKDEERYHILACCCNCTDFDLAFTRLITCRLDSKTVQKMLLTFQDRLRIPWRGGAKQVNYENLIPIVALPVSIGIGALSAYAAAFMFFTATTSVGYVYYLVVQTNTRTRFFCMWMFWSVVYVLFLFEFAVPLLELLPEENFILAVLATASFACLFRARQRSVMNFVGQSNVSQDELPDITEVSAEAEAAAAGDEIEASPQTALLMEHDLLENSSGDTHRQPYVQICNSCRKYVSPRTAHCKMCGHCIMNRDHHSYWLDCCIGKENHIYYLAGLLLAEMALVLGANLTLTAVCHPFLIVRVLNIPIMLPDDCSEVFEEYELGLSFVIALYALLIASYILIMLTRQFYLISRGKTLTEHQRGQSGNRKSYLANWRKFLFH